MDDFDDFDPQGKQRDASRSMIAIVVVLGLLLLWGAVIAPLMSSRREPARPEAVEPSGGADTPKGTESGKQPELRSAPSPGLEPAAPLKGQPPELPPEPQVPAVELTRRSELLCASFTSQEGALARLVLLDHYRTPADKRAALRARRHDPPLDVAPYGLPLLGQEQEAGLDNGGLERPADPSDPQLPAGWRRSPPEDLGKSLLWSQAAHRGARSLAIENPTRDACWSTTVAGIRPGATYELACWARVEAPQGLAEAVLPSVTLVQQDAAANEVVCKDEGTAGASPSRLVLRPRNAAGWQRLDGRFVAQPRTRQVEVRFQAPQGFKGQAWLDDVSLLRFGDPSLVLTFPALPAIRAAEILDLAGICARFSQPASGGEPTPLDRLRELAEPKDLESMRAYAELRKAAAALDAARDEFLAKGQPDGLLLRFHRQVRDSLDSRKAVLEDRLAEWLDSLMRREDLYTVKHFAKAPIPAVAWQYLGGGPADMSVAQLTVFNRILLECIFPTELAKVPKLCPPPRFKVADPPQDAQAAFYADLPDSSVRITKSFALPKQGEPHQRHVLLEVEFANTGDRPVAMPGYWLQGPGGLAADLGPASWKHGETVPNEQERQEAAKALSAVVARQAADGQLNILTRACAKLKDAPFDEAGGVLWAAVASNYFVSILEPQRKDSPGMTVERGGARPMMGGENLSSVIQVAPFTLGPAGKGEHRAVHRFRLYAGPKTESDLAAYAGAHYERVIEPSKLYYLKLALAWVLRSAYKVIPNYGVAIIILTILVRLVLHPLSKKSQTSMAKMSKLQPQIAELREKYKNDKRRQQEEMMKLYKTYGVNPMGGCLPMVLQLPIFIGLWSVLREAIELRHAPFVLWIQDLSQPDSFLGLVNILPLVAIAIMFIQQKMTPKTGDEKQQQSQKMMTYIMPIMLLIFFYKIASGIALYFAASTLIGIGEQKIIKMHMDKLGDLKPVTEKPSKQFRKALLSLSEKKPKRRLF